MTLDDGAIANDRHDAVLPRAAGAAPSRAARPASLVLFVGTPPSSPLCEMLAHDGMRSLWLARPEQALRAGALARFDALVIDVALLGSRAAAWLAEMHSQLRCPLVVVAEHADEIDEIVALELGADAYLARPLAARRLRAHLGALMRLRLPSREQPVEVSPSPPAPSGEAWRVESVANRLTYDGRSILLTEVQCALLQCLAEAKGRIVPRARLTTALPHGHGLSVRNVDVYIHRLRRRLRDEGVNRFGIEAVRGRGYALVGADSASP